MNWRTLIGIVGTSVFVLAIVYFIDWSDLKNALKRLSLEAILLASFCSLISITFLSMRWAILAAPSKSQIGLQEFRDAFFAQIVNLVTPAAVGADAYRIVIAKKREGGHSRAAGLIIFERIVGVAVYSYIFLVAYGFSANQYDNKNVFYISYLVFLSLGAAFVFYLIISRMFSNWLSSWFRLRQYLKVAMVIDAATIIPKRRLLLTVMFSFLATMCWLAAVQILGRSVNVGLNVPDIAMVSIVTEFSRLLPISIQGIGVREATFASLSQAAGGNSNAALVACASAYAIHTVNMMAAGWCAKVLILVKK